MAGAIGLGTHLPNLLGKGRSRMVFDAARCDQECGLAFYLSQPVCTSPDSVLRAGSSSRNTLVVFGMASVHIGLMWKGFDFHAACPSRVDCP